MESKDPFAQPSTINIVVRCPSCHKEVGRCPAISSSADSRTVLFPVLMPSLSLSANFPGQNSPRLPFRRTKRREAIKNDGGRLPAIAGTRRNIRDHCRAWLLLVGRSGKNSRFLGGMGEQFRLKTGKFFHFKKDVPQLPTVLGFRATK